MLATRVRGALAARGDAQAVTSLEREASQTGAPCDQEEFFFRLPFETLDLIWFALEHQIPAVEVATVMGLGEDQIQRVFDDIARKQRTTQFLRLPPPIPEPPQSLSAS